MDDTIAAIASAPEGALRGIVRLSGLDVVRCLERCFRPCRLHDLRRASRACVIPGHVLLPPPLGELECDLYLWPNARSYTRQPAAELHTLGSPPLLEATLRLVCKAGARLAQPGEFTLRAFLAGRMDLTQAEAVLGVIDAHDRRELHVALAQLAGGLAVPLNTLRHELLELLAQVEAGLDFADEGLALLSPAGIERQLSEAAEQVSRIESQLAERCSGQGPPRVVLVGWPNTGKSSLLNALAGDAAALVSHLAGTTRDYVARTIVADGIEVLLVDTAGVEQPDTCGEGLVLAVQRMRVEQATQADLQLLCIDSTRPLNAWEIAQFATAAIPPRIVVLTKTDAKRSAELSLTGIETSSRTGEGLARLRNAIRQQIDALPGRESTAVASTAARCGESLRAAGECLMRARQLHNQQLGDELLAAEVRLALDELGKTVGAVYTEDILDRIFSRFCIGK